MNKPNITEELAEASRRLVDKGYNVCFIAVYGSQNYGLDVYTDEYVSDIDYKAVIIPSLDDLVHNSKPMSTTLEYKDGQIDIKDIRVFMETVVKCNPAYIEVFYTPYSLSSDAFKPIMELAPELVKEQGLFLLKASYGMIKQKEKAFSHPYPTIKDKIEKYGYDPKQLHHIVRLYTIMQRYTMYNKFDMSNPPKVVNDLIGIKLGKHTLEEAEYFRDKYVQLAKEKIDGYSVEPKFNIKGEMLRLSRELTKDNIILTITNEN